MQKIPFLAGNDVNFPYPLKRYLPLYKEGVISQWLQKNSTGEEILLDPLGANPFYALEAAESGFRVFQAQKNPVLQLMTQVLGKGYSKKEFQNTFQLLLDQEWHGEQLGDHIQNLYLTNCRNCGHSISAEGFVWKKDAKVPESVVYLCPYCKESGIFPINEVDYMRLQQVGNTTIYYSRALQRCLLTDVDIEKNIRRALDCYTPRALYIVVALFNTLDQLKVSVEERSMISALLLEIFDQADSLWNWPDREFRPRQLSLPNIYFEKNISLIIPYTIHAWTVSKKNCEVVSFPTLPMRRNGICLFKRKTDIALFSKQNPLVPYSIFCSFPLPNPAFWTLSAIWAAWLFGKKEATNMLKTISQQRYGWYWFAQAIATSLSSVQNEITENKKVFGMCSGFTSSYLLAILLGASNANFLLNGCAVQSDTQTIQFIWQPSPHKKNEERVEQLEPARQQLINYLAERAEPATFHELFVVYSAAPSIHCADLSSLKKESSDYYQKVIHDLHSELDDSKTFQLFKGPTASSSRWMLVTHEEKNFPLDDRIEQEVVNAIYRESRINFPDLYSSLCEIFCSFLTPERNFCKACLESYATCVDHISQHYERDSKEEPQLREQEKHEIADLINETGKKIGVTVHHNDEIVWLNEQGKPLYHFFFSTTAIFSPSILCEREKPGGIPVFIFPASRSRLIVLKKNRNPYLKEILEEHWHLLKFRQVRKISEQEQFSLQAWQDLLDVDPPLWEAPTQMKIL